MEFQPDFVFVVLIFGRKRPIRKKRSSYQFFFLQKLKQTNQKWNSCKLQLILPSYSFHILRKNEWSRWYSRYTARSFNIKEKFSKVMFTNEMSVFWSKSLTKSLLIPGLISFLQHCTASPEISQKLSEMRG